MDVKGRTAVVTGGSGGIGEQIASELAAAGATVAVVARSADKLAAVAERIGGHALTADLTDQADVDGLVARCIDTLGHVDIWVNNAGVETYEAFVRVPRDDIRGLARLNFEAPMMLTRDVLPHMLERGGGHVVQLSSIAGAIPFPALAAYSGSKAGLTNFTETLRIELAGTAVGLTVVAPGPVDTPMWDRLDTGEGYVAPALKRFRQLLFLPKIDPRKLARRTVAAIEKDKRFVRMPARFGMYHWLNNAPRRMVETSLIGVKMEDLSNG